MDQHTQNREAQLSAQMNAMGQAARKATQALANATTKAKNAVLLGAAMTIRANIDDILAANQADLACAKEQNLIAARIDRIMLDATRIEAIARALEEIATLPDPVGTTITQWTPSNALDIERVRTPLGVIGVIYESRPNVTADAAALCMKAGNAVILRGSSEIQNSARAIHNCFEAPLIAAGFDEAAIQLVSIADRAAVGHMLTGLDGTIDVIVPRGGKGLVARVQDDARVPVFAHLEGICHIYVDAMADLDMARAVVLNGKMRRLGICGTTETLLVDTACSDTHLAPLVCALLDAGCEVRGDTSTQAVDTRVKPTQDADWTTEYLDAIISVKCVDGVAGAIAHIEHYGSHHTDSIITDDTQIAERFLREVDSAIVMHNCSTQYADGGEFGMGAEIGIATGRFHARGPIGLEQLTCFKYKVRGDGHCRP